MSILRMIRHAQASYFEDDYDVLSPLGEQQARALGEHWVETGHRLDRVVVGPRRRHRQTMEAVAAAYRRHGVDWPEPEVIDDLDEHDGQAVVDHSLPGLIAQRPELSGLAERTPENLRLYFQAFREITLSWVRDELATPEEVESWSSFRRRVVRGIEGILSGTPRGTSVAAFTSGGPVATAAGQALELRDEKVLELSWRVRNTAYAEILYSENGVMLDTFNANPHLTEPRLVTYI